MANRIIGGKNLSLRGRTFVGVVTSDKMANTVTVEWGRRKYVPKYQRYEKRRSRVKAHNPKEIDAKLGDRVRIVETRPISKTKNFIVVEVLTDDAPAKRQKKAEKPVKQEGEKQEEKKQGETKPTAKKEGNPTKKTE